MNPMSANDKSPAPLAAARRWKTMRERYNRGEPALDIALSLLIAGHARAEVVKAVHYATGFSFTSSETIVDDALDPERRARKEHLRRAEQSWAVRLSRTQELGSSAEHSGLAFRIGPDGRGVPDESVVIPDPVVAEGFDKGLWYTLNDRLGILLEDREREDIPSEKLDRLAGELIELSGGLSPDAIDVLREVATLARRLAGERAAMGIDL